MMLRIDDKIALEDWEMSETFMRAQNFIRTNRKVEAPCVLMMNKGESSIFDGNHRVAAFASLHEASGFMLDAWVGS